MAPFAGGESVDKMEALALMDQRAAIEAEMQGIINNLTGPNGPGISGNLVDAAGFPRADIDIPRIRAERHRLTVLRTDHKEVTAKIEEKLHALHSGGPSKITSRTSSKATGEASVVEDATTPGVTRAARYAEASKDKVNNSGPAPMEEDIQNRQPFAIFDQIAEGSPAAVDGLLLGDQLVRFGTVEGGGSVLQRLAQEYQGNEGRSIPVVVLRHGIEVHLSVTPRRWSGNGLLGCHVQPL